MASPEKAKQIAFDLPGRAAHGRDDLVVSAANRQAVAMIDRWPAWPANVVALTGPKGSGKTHLAAAWCEESGAGVLLAADLSAARPEAFSRPIVIEDADAGDLDEAGLFHVLNAAREAGSHVLLTGRRPVPAWPVALPDLRSRLRTAVAVQLDAPDEPLLSGVIAKLFADRQTAVEPAVVQFVARRIERSLDAAASAVAALDAAALERKSRVTRALAASVLTDAGEAPDAGATR